MMKNWKKVTMLVCALCMSISVASLTSCNFFTTSDTEKSEASSNENVSVEVSNDASEETSDVASEETSDVASEETSDVASEETSDVASEETSDVTSEETSDVTSEETSDVTSEETSDVTSDVTSEETSDVASEEDSVVEEVVEYTITFDGNGGAVVEESVVVEEGEKIVKPEDPTKEYYTFIGWYNGEVAWNFEEDTVSSDLTITAKWECTEYVLKFVDFDGVETELAYTVETAEEFALPEVPTAPEHYENARWNKTLEECLVYSAEAIVVEAIADPVNYMVSFINCEGVDDVEVAYNTTTTAPEAVRDGFVLKGWYLDGEEYDFATPITGDTILVARWYVVSTENEKTTMVSAEEVSTAITASLDPYITANEGVVEGQSWASWAYDSDYHCALPSGQVDANSAHLLTRGVNLTSNTTGDTSITMPKVNYTLYSKVDFACIVEGSAITGGSINGTTFTRPDQWLFSIVTDSTGTKLIVYTMNAQVANPTTIVLPEAVANGEEGLTLTLTLNGWSRYFITEFHGTARVVDYQEKIAEAIAILESDDTSAEEKSEALQAYDKYVPFRTEYEKASDPDVVVNAREGVYYNAIINAENGSQAQYEAINAYRAYSANLSDDEKASEAHKANVVAINTILTTHFVENKTVTFENAPTVSGATYTGDQVGTSNCHTSHKSSAYAHYYMAQFSSEPNDGTFTLNAFNFSAYDEVRFGLFAITGGNGTITIGDGSTSFDASKAHYYKVVVRNGVLTAYDDSNDNADGGGVVFTATLDASVLNGTAGLVIDFQFDAWSQAEITEIYATKVGNKVFGGINNQATIAGDTTEQKYARALDGGYNGAYQTVEWTYANLAQTNGGNITFTLPAFDFNAKGETIFGLCFAATGSYGTITINGQSVSCPSELLGHWLSMKVVIKDGTLTIVDDCGKGLGTVFTVELSDAVLNGTEGLVIAFSGDGWSQVEITDMSVTADISPIA